MKLIHCFEVPPGREDEFVQGWNRLTKILQGADGYIGTEFYRKTADVGRFAFINVAEWRDEEAWRAAVASEIFQAQLELMTDFTGYPGLYELAYEETAVS
ncbi:MAG: antibiotic biosynthesis monooxygenase family protein [Pseudomonas sp.]|uniref:antibiotic biosynthesis monooxygenase family protein n=1 Tax=Pseudomonas sp. TaxID=306 RepID=UPI003D6E0ECC